MGRTRQVYTTPGHSWEPQYQSGRTKRLSGRPTPRRSAGTAGVSLRSTSKAWSSQTLATRSSGRTEAPQWLPPGHLPKLGAAGPKRGDVWTPGGCHVDTDTRAGSDTCAEPNGETSLELRFLLGCQEPEPATQARAARSAQGGLTAGVTSSFNIAKPTGGLTILKKQITHTHFGRKCTDKIQVPFFKKKKFLNLNFYKSTTAWISLVV